jgi:hypothetical protein
MQKQIHEPVFSGHSENSFMRITLLEQPFRGGMTTLKNKDAFVRRKTVTSFTQTSYQ